MTGSRRSLLLRIATAFAIGLAYPHLELAWKCRAPYESSEACVWGRAYLPLGLWIEPLIVTPVAFAVLSLISYMISRGRPGPHDAR